MADEDATVEHGFRGEVAQRSAGITYRQLDYWARTGLVSPSVRPASGSGSQRLYSFTDVVHLKIIKRLLDAGISLQKIRRAIEYLRDELRQPLEDAVMLSDGKTVYASASPGELIDLLRGGQAVFAIAVGEVYKEIQGTIAEFRKPDTEGQGVPAERSHEARSV
ncbi:MAG TPA: MerR family transcriptional regulator [Actinomycetota bacterium]